MMFQWPLTADSSLSLSCQISLQHLIPLTTTFYQRLEHTAHLKGPLIHMVPGRDICEMHWFKSQIIMKMGNLFKTWKLVMELHRALSWNQQFLILCMLPLDNIVKKHCIHFHSCEDDTQHYLSMKPDDKNLLLSKIRPSASTLNKCFFLIAAFIHLHSASKIRSVPVSE